MSMTDKHKAALARLEEKRQERDLDRARIAQLQETHDDMRRAEAEAQVVIRAFSDFKTAVVDRVEEEFTGSKANKIRFVDLENLIRCKRKPDEWVIDDEQVLKHAESAVTIGVYKDQRLLHAVENFYKDVTTPIFLCRVDCHHRNFKVKYNFTDAKFQALKSTDDWLLVELAHELEVKHLNEGVVKVLTNDSFSTLDAMQLQYASKATVTFETLDRTFIQKCDFLPRSSCTVQRAKQGASMCIQTGVRKSTGGAGISASSSSSSSSTDSGQRGRDLRRRSRSRSRSRDRRNRSRSRSRDRRRRSRSRDSRDRRRRSRSRDSRDSRDLRRRSRSRDSHSLSPSRRRDDSDDRLSPKGSSKKAASKLGKQESVFEELN